MTHGKKTIVAEPPILTNALLISLLIHACSSLQQEKTTSAKYINLNLFYRVWFEMIELIEMILSVDAQAFSLHVHCCPSDAPSV